MSAELSSQLPKKHPQGNTPMSPPEGENEPTTVSTARRITGNLRATVMEGSFGINIPTLLHLLHDSKPPKRTAKKKNERNTKFFNFKSQFSN